MGCIMSSLSGTRTTGPRVLDREAYYRHHPGLHNPTTRGIESETSRNVRLPDPKDTETIQVEKVDLLIKENTKAHHTDEFDITNGARNDNKELLVVRRGQSFDIKLVFNRQYDDAKDDLRVVFQFGKQPLPSRKSHIEFILSNRDRPNEWGAYIKAKEGNSLLLDVMTPPTISIGKWKLKIDVIKKNDQGVTVYRFEQKDPIYVLFNPWCRDDSVYMHEEKLLDEYILNQTGKIYAGNKKNISPKPWVFGQFDGDILDCCLYLLEQANIPDYSSGNPITVCRKISALVNTQDDRGVLAGNWSGSYVGGTSPLDWTGSVAILEKYYKTKTTVEYGQCWVFSGVVTTVCRALGIPARSVTNFASAHDTDGSVTIDTFFDEKHEKLEHMNSDSVWNFHVWNDVWMARPDLDSGYGGWQAIDATPQETSEGIYCMGPMSLLALKRGEIHLPYDGRFAFAEVNADRLYWVVSGTTGEMKMVKQKKNSVGQFISTKRAFGKATWREIAVCHDLDREDVTDQYKFPERSNEERAAVRKANLHSTKERDVYQPAAEDVAFDLSSKPNTYMGDEMEVTLKISNKSDSKRTINGSIFVSSIYYTGVPYKDVDKKTLDALVVDPKAEQTVTMKIPVDDYLDKIMDHCMFKISCICMVEETKQTYAELEEQRLRKPHLTVKAPDSGNLGKTFNVEVSFTNPLPQSLTKCELRVEGPGLQRPVIYKQKNVETKQTYVGSFNMTPGKPGEREIVVYFNCAQISSVNSSHVIKVSE